MSNRVWAPLPSPSGHQTELQICFQIKNKLEKHRTHTDGFVSHNRDTRFVAASVGQSFAPFLPLMCHDRTNNPINTLKSPERPAPCRSTQTPTETYIRSKEDNINLFLCPAATYLRKRTSHSGFVFGTNSWERPPLLPLVYVTACVIWIEYDPPNAYRHRDVHNTPVVFH